MAHKRGLDALDMSKGKRKRGLDSDVFVPYEGNYVLVGEDQQNPTKIKMKKYPPTFIANLSYNRPMRFLHSPEVYNAFLDHVGGVNTVPVSPLARAELEHVLDYHLVSPVTGTPHEVVCNKNVRKWRPITRASHALHLRPSWHRRTLHGSVMGSVDMCMVRTINGLAFFAENTFLEIPLHIKDAVPLHANLFHYPDIHISTWLQAGDLGLEIEIRHPFTPETVKLTTKRDFGKAVAMLHDDSQAIEIFVSGNDVKLGSDTNPLAVYDNVLFVGSYRRHFALLHEPTFTVNVYKMDGTSHMSMQGDRRTRVQGKYMIVCFRDTYKIVDLYALRIVHEDSTQYEHVGFVSPSLVRIDQRRCVDIDTGEIVEPCDFPDAPHVWLLNKDTLLAIYDNRLDVIENSRYDPLVHANESLMSRYAL